MDNFGSHNLYNWTHDHLMNVLTGGSDPVLKDPLLINAFKNVDRANFVLEAQKDHGIPPELRANVAAGLPDGEVTEQRAAIFVTALDESGQGREVERLAEAPRARQQQHACVRAQHIDDEGRLVDIAGATLAELAEVRGTDGEKTCAHEVSLVGRVWLGEGVG